MTNSKSKRILSLMLSFIMFATLSAFFCIDTASAATSGDWEYKTVTGGVDITAYKGTSENIVVPATLSGYKVVSVSGLYSGRKNNVKSVTFSSGIKSIGSSVLKDYTMLTSVSLGSVNTIGAGAFEGCKALKTVIIPSSVNSVGAGAFAGCTALKSISITSRMAEIPDRMFMNCSALSNITIPNYVTTIGDSAFSGCTSLQTVTFPTTLTTIGSSAFENCTSLSSPVLPNQSLKTIEQAAFKGCTSILTVFIPNSVARVKDSAFYGCSSMTNAYVSPSVKVLEKNAFSNCPKLTKIVFGGANSSFSSFFSTATKPAIYYPTKNASSWKSLSYSNKQAYSSYSVVPSIKSVSLVAGKSKTVSVSVSPKNSPIGDGYIFASDNIAIATVNSNGVIVAKGPGITKINVTDVTGKKQSITVTVTPSAPVNVKAVPKSTSSITVSWKMVTGATGYYVYRYNSSTKKYDYIGSTMSTSFIDKGLKKGTRYYYAVRTGAKVGKATKYSGYSAVVNCNATSPTPANVTATKAAAGRATIKWGKSLGAAGYDVFMATSAGGKYTRVGSAGASALQYTKTGLTNGKTYYFKVCSYTTVNGKKVYSPYSSYKSVRV